MPALHTISSVVYGLDFTTRFEVKHEALDKAGLLHALSLRLAVLIHPTSAEISLFYWRRNRRNLSEDFKE